MRHDPETYKPQIKRFQGCVKTETGLCPMQQQLSVIYINGTRDAPQF